MFTYALMSLHCAHINEIKWTSESGKMAEMEERSWSFTCVVYCMSVTHRSIVFV